MNNALFIDVSTLNVLFRVDDKLVFATNYSGNPERLVLDSQALGVFDVYLSLYPRVEEEGDVRLDHLKFGQVPYWISLEEVEACFKFVEKIPSVNDIYLCNALANFMKPARVGNYKVLLCYGHRYLLVESRENLPESIEIITSQQEFYDRFGEEYSCYGEMDLVDIESFRSLHPELSKVRKSILVPLASIIAAQDAKYCISKEVMYKDIVSFQEKQLAECASKIEESEEEDEEPTTIVEVKTPKKEKAVRQKVDWVTAGCTTACCLCALLLGFGFQFKNTPTIISNYRENIEVFESDRAFNETLTELYEKSKGLAGEGAEVLAYAKSSELGITVTGFEVFSDRMVVQFNSLSTEVKDKYVYYMERKYSITSVNEYGTVNNTDGTVTHEYGLTVLR